MINLQKLKAKIIEIFAFLLYSRDNVKRIGGIKLNITIKEVAKVAGVSTATVSMVINKKADHITQKTKDKVFDAIKKLDYKPNYAARSLVSAQSYMIGLLLPDITNPFFAELAKELETCLNHAGYITFLCNSTEDSQQESRYIEELIARSVDGMIICGLTKGNEDKLALLRKKKIPYLNLDSRFIQNKYAIKIDDHRGGKLAANHLLELNHEIVAFIGSKSDFSNIWNRYKGFSEVITTANKKIRLFETELTKEGGKEVADQLFASDATAVFCSNDLIAVGIYEQARKRGIQIPEQLSVVGFDDISFADILIPKLTTIRQPMRDVAHMAVKQLLKMIKDRNYAFISEVLPVELIVRESTAKLK